MEGLEIFWMAKQVRKMTPADNRVDRLRRRFFLATLFFTSMAILNTRALAQNSTTSAVPASADRDSSNSAPLAGKGQAILSIEPVQQQVRPPKHPDFNRSIYYRNKLEFSLEAGWLPINIPFPLNVFEGAPYNLYPLRYTLVPVVASLRWHVNGIGGPLILRGNWDVTFSGSYTAIPRGAETRYFSYDMGIRRNFVPRNWPLTPYWDLRFGLGDINAKGPLGVYYAQGQNFTFNMNMGSGLRYNVTPRCAVSVGLNYMHISNANLSAPKYSNYGINVYGPMVGIDFLVRSHSRRSE